MDVRALTGSQPTGQPSRSISYGTVSVEQPAPASVSDPLYVVIPSHSAELSIRFDSWPQLHGGTLPAPGADVVVAWDERDGGVPHVVWWDGEWSVPPSLIRRGVVVVRTSNASGGDHYTTGGPTADIDPVNLTRTMVCSGGPVRVALSCLIGTAATSADAMPMDLRMDSTYMCGGLSGTQFYIADQSDGAWLHLETVFFPTAGSHVFAPMFGGNGIVYCYVYCSATKPVTFEVLDLGPIGS